MRSPHRWDVVKAVILASPGFIKDELHKFIIEEVCLARQSSHHGYVPLKRVFEDNSDEDEKVRL